MCSSDHIGIGVTDCEQIKESRAAVPRPLGYHFVTDIDMGIDTGSGFGVDAKTVSTAYGAAPGVDV